MPDISTGRPSIFAERQKEITMKIFNGLEINNMSGGNEGLWLWLDIKIGSYWYVFMWVKKSKPYLYKSKDATPPRNKSEGKWIFGKDSRGRC